MKLAVSFLVHANLQYAEIPSSEIPKIVEKSYLPALDIFIKHPEAKVVMDFSGVTLEWLSKDYPEVIEKLRFLISQGNIELCGGTYSNPILPLIPLDHADKQIEKFNQIHQKLFGDLKVKPAGFFPHEYFFDAEMRRVYQAIRQKDAQTGKPITEKGKPKLPQGLLGMPKLKIANERDMYTMSGWEKEADKDNWANTDPAHVAAKEESKKYGVSESYGFYADQMPSIEEAIQKMEEYLAKQPEEAQAA